MANIEPIDNTQQPISDDQELAKVLAGVSQEADDAADAGVGTVVPPAATDDATTSAPDPIVSEPSVLPEPTVAPVESLVNDTPDTTSQPSVSPLNSDLTTVKQEALSELRPLVDKLDVNPEEKFDTYLLLLRSTDDRDLIAPAHEAAKAITDEARRAQALLDIIKEIDFLSQSQQ
jgi:hypothetical protein